MAPAPAITTAALARCYVALHCIALQRELDEEEKAFLYPIGGRCYYHNFSAILGNFL
jgi:hypothetical protein